MQGCEANRTPRRWVFMLALLATAATIHLGLMLRTKMPSRDSLGFARVALQLYAPDADSPTDQPSRSRWDVLRQAEHPPAYPVAIWLMSYAVRAFHPGSLGEQFLFSAQLVNLLAGMALAVVLFHLGAELFGERVGFIAAWTFPFLPVVARITSDGLSEATFLLASASALLLAIRAIRRPSGFNAWLCGLMIAAAYLVRPEGLLIAPVVLLVFAIEAVSRRLTPRGGLTNAAALAVGLLLLATPYMAIVGGITNKPTGRKLIQWILGGSEASASSRPQHHAHASALQASAPELVDAAWPVTDKPPLRRLLIPCTGLLGSWYVEGEGISKPVWIALTLIKETAKAFHYLPGLLALAGLLITWRDRVRANVAIRMLGFYGSAHAGLLVVMAASSGYLSERHTLPLVMVGIFFAAYALDVGIRAAAGYVKRPANGWLSASVALIVISCLPPLARARHDDRWGHLHAGRWLAEHATPRDAIVDPYEWAQFYAGRTLFRIPPNPDPVEAYYAILEEGKSNRPRSLLPKHWYAEALARQGRPVFQWPEGSEPNAVRVVIYRVDTTLH